MAAHGLALLIFAVLTAALTWPLVLRLGEVVAFDLGDPLLSTWTLWWNASVIPFTSRWWDGLAFFPAERTLTFSDHRVGLGPIASPLIWLGVSPLAAHNVTFLLTFFLSAAAAYALGFALTRSRAAALIGGLVFGFNPFRAGHLPHLELLASYWLPIVLLALHRWRDTRGGRWLVLLTVALLMQALTSGYYFAFAAVLLGLWLLWFTPRDLAARQYAALGVAFLLPVVAMTPLLLEYREAHAALGLSRSITEIEELSADIIGLVTAPATLAFWRTPSDWQQPEGALLPGATAVLLVAAALWRRGTPPAPPLPRWARRARIVLLVGAMGAAAVAMVPVAVGPVAQEIAGLQISVSRPYKPLAIATWLFVGWLLSTNRVRAGWSRRSALTFYALATVAMWIFALGPTARLLGHRVLYAAPYSWLMIVPTFRDEFRAPARFAMLAALTLGVAASLAFWRLTRERSARTRLLATTLVAGAIMVESWVHPFPLPAPPRALDIPAGVPDSAVVLELPMGVYEDAAAMYRSTRHGRRTVNGMSGYEPPHYGVLRSALEERNVTVLPELASRAAIAIFVARTEAGRSWAQRLATQGVAAPAGTTETHDVLLMPHAPRPSRPAVGRPAITVRRVVSESNAAALPGMLDGDYLSVWTSGEPQTGGEAITVDLGEALQVEALVLAQGRWTTAFPRFVEVEISPDGSQWTSVWRGDPAALTMAAALDDPGRLRVTFTFPPEPARFVRVRQTGRSESPWAVAELQVLGTARTRVE